MLEYTLDDAELLLTKNHSAALKSLEVVDSDLGFLRDQTTTIEVSILFEVTTTMEIVLFCFYERRVLQTVINGGN